MKKLSFAAAFLSLFLLSGCAKPMSIPVLNGESAETVEFKRGETIRGGALVYTADGNVFYAEDYKIKEELIGLILDPPDRRVTDAYCEAVSALDCGEKVLLIYIDGLGFGTFQNALADGDVPALSMLHAEQAASVFPTITPVNYAAMITGQPPKENGVSQRGVHGLQCPTIFDYAAEKNISSYASEGDTQILKLNNAQLELSPDLNGNGTSDDEIFDCAMEAIGKYGLLFVHFHSVDDTSHEYSPESREAREALIRVDGWCGELMENWDGKVIITADHGQHTQDGTGDEVYSDRSGTHGDFAVSDIFVPFLTN